MDVVIQLWKGWCPKFAGIQNFPGGVGAEVGIYRRIPGRTRPSALPNGLSPDIIPRLLSALASYADHELWWPFPELAARLECEFINPLNGQVVFSGGPENTYWLTKWMDDDSYRQYQRDAPTPASVVDYRLGFKINGRRYPSWPPVPGEMNDTIVNGWQLLLT
jgi:hypothetical protein